MCPWMAEVASALVPVLGTLAIDLVILVALLCLGGLTAAVALREPDPLGVLALALPLGIGGYTWLLFLLSLAGVDLTRMSLIAVYLGSLVGLGVTGRMIGRPRWKIGFWKPAACKLPGSLESRLVSAAWLVLLAVLASAMVISVGRAHSRWDEIVNWVVKGYGIALEGTVEAAARWGSFGRAYPLNVHLINTIFKLADGDLLPGSKLAFPLFLLSLVLGCIWFWRKLRVPWLQAILAGIMLASIPVVFLHATLAYANLTYTTYLVLGTLVGLLQISSDDRGLGLLQGSLFGMAAWTRAEGVGFVVALGLILVVVRGLARRPVLDGLIWVLPVLVMVSPWWLFSAQDVAGSHLGSAVEIFLDDWSIGDFHSEEFVALPVTLGQRMLTPAIWGMYLFALLSISAIGLLRTGRRPPPEVLGAAAAAIVISLIVIAMFYIRSYSKGGYPGFLERAFDRAFFPGAVMLWVTAVALLGGSRSDPHAEGDDG